MENKYALTREEEIYLAKRNIIDSIWKSANLEGIGVTFPETNAIYEGVNVPSLKVAEVIAINNLKHGWQFLLDSIDEPVTLPYIQQINYLVGTGIVFNAGSIRSFEVNIGGTKWKPGIPDYDAVKTELEEILALPNATERAITVMLWLLRSQLFADGNKRTGMFIGNKLMLQGGCGIIAVPLEKQAEFLTLLVGFYETGAMETIKAFVYEHCIEGMEKEVRVDPRKVFVPKF